MGTISNKLTYLNETKQKLKDDLNKFGAELTENDTFRSYSNVLNDIYDKLPRVTGNGSSFTLEDAQNGYLDDFKMYGNTEQDTAILPSGYTQVDYITTTGTAYIDTDVKAKGSLKIISDIEFVDTPSGNMFLFGGRDSAITNANTLLYSNSNTSFRNDYNTTTNFATPSITNLLTKWHIVKDKGSLILTSKDNQTITQSTTNETFISNYNMYIFNANNGGSAMNQSKYNLYNFTIYDDTTLVRDFIPCYRNSDNEIGLYDIVNGVFYTKQGSGSFSYGSTVSIPSPDYPQDVRVVTGNNSVKVIGKNLLNDYDLINRYNIASISDNILTTNAINSNYSVFQPRTKTQKIDLVENTKYYVSFDCRLKSGTYSAKLGASIINGIDGTSYSTGNTAISNPNMSSSYQRYSFECISNITTNSVLGISIQVQAGLSNAVFEIKNIMISTSSNNSYEPYQSQTYPINLGSIELCKIGTYQDYIYKDSGKWYKHKEIGKVVLDGSEDWNNTYGVSLFGIDKALNSKPFVVGYGLSNYYKYNPVQSGINNNTSNGEFALQKASAPDYNIFIKNTDYSTLTDFKNWLSTHNTIVYYPLETPTNTEITDTTLISQLNAIETYTGTNTFSVSNSNGVLPTINVERLKELDKLN